MNPTPSDTATSTSFEATVAASGKGPLRRRGVETLQVNLGRLCNQACFHCHVEAGPGRTENMDERTIRRVLELLARSPSTRRLDLTGGAPEMNPGFRMLVECARALEREVMVRSNLTILVEPGYEDMVDFFASRRVKVVASLPCYTRENVEAQRGEGVFPASIEALRRLNAAGFGREGSGLVLDLVYNPLGPSLPGPQAALEAAYKEKLGEDFGIVFNSLLAITNMPIKRFAGMLEKEGRVEEYARLLREHFNPATVPGLMCLDLLSVAYDGSLHDCDFNQMLELPLGGPPEGAPRTIFEIESFENLGGLSIRTAAHCFGCTAGAGSSCGGSLA